MTDISKIDSIVRTMQHSRIQHYALPFLDSYMIGGGPHGKVRLFESGRNTEEFIIPHSHRFDFTCLVLKGEVWNYVLRTQNWGPDGPRANFYLKSRLIPKKELPGEYEKQSVSWGWYEAERSRYTAGDVYSMNATQIHYIEFSRGARVLFFEGPAVENSSVILEPATEELTCTGPIRTAVKTFKVEPWMFQHAAE
jgi:hypothetical protein